MRVEMKEMALCVRPLLVLWRDMGCFRKMESLEW